MEHALKKEFNVDYTTVIWNKKVGTGIKHGKDENKAHISTQYVNIIGPISHNVKMFKYCRVGMTPDRQYLILNKTINPHDEMNNYKVQVNCHTDSSSVRVGTKNLIQKLNLQRGVYDVYSDAVNNSIVVKLF